jgi:hypothetical protein
LRIDDILALFVDESDLDLAAAQADGCQSVMEQKSDIKLRIDGVFPGLVDESPPVADFHGGESVGKTPRSVKLGLDDEFARRVDKAPAVSLLHGKGDDLLA